MKKPIIFADKIEITYNLGKQNEFKANKGTTLEVYPEEYIILFGPSGCGKSTLLYCMFGVLPPSAGKLYVKGDSIYDFTPEQVVFFQRKTMGIMYQSFNLIPSITTLDNVALPLIFAGVPPAVREARAMELLKRYNVGHVAHRRPTLLSGGQQQRVSAARSLVNDPAILIADEPVGNLDFTSAAQVMETLRDINERDKVTVLLVTHNAAHLPYAHRVVYMTEGKVLRVVPNPERPQILKIEPGKAITTEIEQVARLFPYASPIEQQVKSLVNYLTQDLTFDQITRLEKSVLYVATGRMNRDTFYQTLTFDEAHGGLGLDEAPARAMADKLAELIGLAKNVARLRKLKDENVLLDVHHEYVENIINGILERVRVDGRQRENLREAVLDRVSGFTRREEFSARLELAIDKGGVGLSIKDNFHLTRYLEKLIALGVASAAPHE